MHFSRPFKASSHCQSSPDGQFVATLFSSSISTRSTKSLEVVKVTKLPHELSGTVYAFSWSPSSRYVLVATADQVHVFSAVDGDFHAVIRNASPPGAKRMHVAFGTSDNEICICSPYGLKLAVFNLASSQAVEISNPKFHTTSTAGKGYSFRPQTNHLAVLTRMSGKDMISIHHPATRELQRSWHPDTVDAQGLLWSPDGRWLVVWDSPGQGHKVLFYTPDGNLYKAWLGPHMPVTDVDSSLGAGVKHIQFSPDAKSLAVGDNSRCMCILNVRFVGEAMKIHHPNSVVPQDTLQIWQEQASTVPGNVIEHRFIKATQAIYPPIRQSRGNSDTTLGCLSMSFNSSSSLLATRLEESPSTVWIWDIESSELRSVLMFHTNVSKVVWHPSIRETLLIGCEGDEYQALAFVWDPLSDGPRLVDFTQQISGPLLTGKTDVRWLNMADVEPGALFFSDSKEYLLASLAASDEDNLPWEVGAAAGIPSAARTENTSLDMTAADIHDGFEGGEDDEASEMDDTFHFKKDVLV